MSRVVVAKLDCRRCGKGKAAELCVKERLRSFGSAGGAEPQDDAFFTVKRDARGRAMAICGYGKCGALEVEVALD